MSTTARNRVGNGNVTDVDGGMVITRPEGMHPARWDRVKVEVHNIVTGHAPWCDDHQDDGRDGYCRTTRYGACIEVVLTTGTDGSTIIAYNLTRGVHPSELTIMDAACIASVLAGVVDTAQGGNLTRG